MAELVRGGAGGFEPPEPPEPPPSPSRTSPAGTAPYALRTPWSRPWMRSPPWP